MRSISQGEQRSCVWWLKEGRIDEERGAEMAH